MPRPRWLPMLRSAAQGSVTHCLADACSLPTLPTLTASLKRSQRSQAGQLRDAMGGLPRGSYGAADRATEGSRDSVRQAPTRSGAANVEMCNKHGDVLHMTPVLSAIL
jgi:hypothetical protein